MASAGMPKEYNDSSGQTGKKCTQPKGILPKAIKIDDRPVTRDSGCYTGSPATVAMAHSPVDRFLFGESISSTYPVHSTPPSDQSTDHQVSHLSMEEMPTARYDTDSYAEDDDDVFEHNFVDSGIQSFGIHSGEYDTSEMSQLSDHTPSTCTDGDDSSTEEGEEFVTAEFKLEDDDSPTSNPIDIPNTKWSAVTLSGAVAPVSAAAASAPTTASHSLLNRRQTVLGETQGERPHSGYGRMQGTDGQMANVTGPLPDVVPHRGLRSRAFSESALLSSYTLRQMGTNLRDISDEFCTLSLRRRHNQQNLVQQVQQQNVDRRGNSRETAENVNPGRRRNSLLNKLFGDPLKE